MAKILARPETRERFASQALEPGSLGAGEVADYLKAAAAKWGKSIQDAGIVAK